MGAFASGHPVITMTLAVAAGVTSTALTGRVMWPLEAIVAALLAIALVGTVAAVRRAA